MHNKVHAGHLKRVRVHCEHDQLRVGHDVDNLQTRRRGWMDGWMDGCGGSAYDMGGKARVVGTERRVQTDTLSTWRYLFFVYGLYYSCA